MKLIVLFPLEIMLSTYMLHTNVVTDNNYKFIAVLDNL